jgi:hypothetical protein
MTIDRIRANSLFILGVQKAGTTSLHDLLAQHPAIAAADPKEPNHYIKTSAKQRMILQDGSTELSALPYYGTEDYAAIFAPTSDETRFFLDSSTGYFPYDEALDAIAQRCTDPRVIVVLREPVSRAYSAYNWARKVGWEPLESFEEALAAEPARRAQDYWFSFWYAGHGLYADRLVAVQKRFPDCRFVLFDDLIADPAQVCRDVFAWLGLPHAPVESLKANPSGVDRGLLKRKLRAIVTRRRTEQGPIAAFVRKIIPAKLLRSIKGKITSDLDARIVPPARLSDELKAQLAEGFASDIAATEKLIGRDLGAWKKPRA